MGPPASGLIPAHAGKTTVVNEIIVNEGAHPRSRGENVRGRPQGQGRTGSSPLTRGKLGVLWAAACAKGLIPAHAGKTAPYGQSPIGPRAHPRSRGENDEAWAFDAESGGSSPLTRGKPRCGCARLGDAGLIPAHAGKTSSDSSSARSARAHPRSRGENLGGGQCVSRVAGSSPLTRGKRGRNRTGHYLTRLIPAHAGKTSASPEPSRSSRAHPRSRGENVDVLTINGYYDGSSPLTRGKH